MWARGPAVGAAVALRHSALKKTLGEGSKGFRDAASVILSPSLSTYSSFEAIGRHLPMGQGEILLVTVYVISLYLMLAWVYERRQIT